MKILVFEWQIAGHHLEYLHHYHVGATARSDERFIFCVDPAFLEQKGKYLWTKSTNIRFEYLTKEDTAKIKNAHGWKYGLVLSKLIRDKVKLYGCDRVILTNFIFMIPFLLFLMPRGVYVRGIIYRIYLYNKDKTSWLRYHIEDFCYRLMAKSHVMEKVFILNDQHSTDVLNSRFNTQKFTFLPDPVPVVDMSKLCNLRKKLGIPEQNIVFLHFGGLTKRKGTLEILKAIHLSSAEELKNKTFVFAGRIYENMHEDFYDLLQVAKQKVQILVFDEFCPYEFLYNLCYTCDVILIPYFQTDLSSGVLGYAAVFNKPVIGPSNGLIGNIIKRYNLGAVLTTVSPSEILKSLNRETCFKANSYCEHNSLSTFITNIFS